MDDKKTARIGMEVVLNDTDAAMMMSGKVRARTGKSGRSRWHSASPVKNLAFAGC